MRLARDRRRDGEAAEYAHARFGLPVVEGDLLEVGLAPLMTPITLFDVLEHRFEPAAVLHRAEEQRLPEAGGIVALTCPTGRAWTAACSASIG